MVETLNGNWAILYMKGVLHAGASLAALTLTMFWAAATAGRLLFAAVERWLPARRTFGLLPWVIALAFVATALVPSSTPALGAVAFGLAGLGCSALLPLTISLGRVAASPGDLIACYQLGYGLAAFGVAPLHDRAGLGLRVLFGGGAAIALALAALSIAISRRSTSNQKGPRRRRHPEQDREPQGDHDPRHVERDPIAQDRADLPQHLHVLKDAGRQRHRPEPRQQESQVARALGLVDMDRRRLLQVAQELVDGEAEADHRQRGPDPRHQRAIRRHHRAVAGQVGSRLREAIGGRERPAVAHRAS